MLFLISYGHIRLLCSYLHYFTQLKCSSKWSVIQLSWGMNVNVYTDKCKIPHTLLLRYCEHCFLSGIIFSDSFLYFLLKKGTFIMTSRPIKRPLDMTFIWYNYIHSSYYELLRILLSWARQYCIKNTRILCIRPHYSLHYFL